MEVCLLKTTSSVLTATYLLLLNITPIFTKNLRKILNQNFGLGSSIILIGFSMLIFFPQTCRKV